MAEGLVLTAHHPEGHHHLVALRDHAGDDGVQRPFAALDPVRAGRVQAEALGPVGQGHARRRADARAEIVEQRVDETAGVAVAIDHRDVDRALMVRQVDQPRRSLHPGRVDGGAQAVGVFHRQKLGHRHRGHHRIGNPGVARRIGQPSGLDLGMHPLYRERAFAGLDPAEDVQEQERDHPLAVRRALVDGVAAEFSRDRGDVFACRAGEILQRMQPAMRLQGPHDILGRLSRIHLVAAVLGDPPEGRGQLGLAMQSADPGDLPSGQEDARGMLVALEHLLPDGEVHMHP